MAFDRITKIKPNIAILHRENDRSPGYRIQRSFLSLGYKCASYAFNSQIIDSKHNCIIYVDNADYHIYPKLSDVPHFYLAIDTTIDKGHRCITQSQNMDFIFYAQKIAKDIFPTKSQWLPNAHDESLCNLHITPYVYRSIDIASIGSFDDRKDRHNIKRLIEKNFEKSNRVIVNDLPYEQIARLYNNTKIVINPTLGDINLRTFEACGYGAICVTHLNEANGIYDLGFSDLDNCILYNSDGEAISSIHYALDNIYYAEIIAKNGYNLVNNRHTYKHRAKIILEVWKKLLSQKSKNVSEEGANAY